MKDAEAVFIMKVLTAAMNELCLHGLIHGKSKRIFYVIHNQIIACVQWYRVNIWKIYSVSKEKFFRTDFAACRISCRNADPELYIPFSWKQQAFSAVYLLETYGKTEAGGIDYLLQILWMRGGIFFSFL